MVKHVEQLIATEPEKVGCYVESDVNLTRQLTSSTGASSCLTRGSVTATNRQLWLDMPSSAQTFIQAPKAESAKPAQPELRL